jgi:Fe-S-cluster-containing hydrogenase component 2
VVDATGTGRLFHNQDVCAGCGICEAMCSLFHEGVSGQALARSHIVRQPFTAKHSHVVCRQCSSPGCYSACPLKDRALCIDEVTGTVYVDESECIGCGTCIDACPFDPPHVKMNTMKNVVFKCDLCRGREGGPICIEYCPFQALKIQSKGQEQ